MLPALPYIEADNLVVKGQNGLHDVANGCGIYMLIILCQSSLSCRSELRVQLGDRIADIWEIRSVEIHQLNIVGDPLLSFFVRKLIVS